LDIGKLDNFTVVKVKTNILVKYSPLICLAIRNTDEFQLYAAENSKFLIHFPMGYKVHSFPQILILVNMSMIPNIRTTGSLKNDLIELNQYLIESKIHSMPVGKYKTSMHF